MWKISKDFSFCYGHRVWTQKLEADYCESGDTSCKCKHLHGHEGLVRVFLEGQTLNNSMVTDFKHLGWLKNFLDNVLDHKFVIDKNDPMFGALVLDNYMTATNSQHLTTKSVCIPGTPVGVGESLVMDNVAPDTPIYETLEGFFIVDFVPTSENFSRWLFNIVSIKMAPLNVKVSAVEWWETPKSCSTYYG
jgi:6-pyruvoyltetrahydropterin/6-carboxytetrahydropterin synthase